MPIIIAFLFLYVFSPVIGFFYAGAGVYSYSFYELSSADIFSRFFFSFIYFFFILFFLKYNIYLKGYRFGDFISGREYTLSFNAFLFPLFIAVVFVFVMTGYKTIVLNANTGDLRVSHGYLGPFYRLVVGFVIPVISALVAFSYNKIKVKTNSVRFVFVLYFFLIVIAAFFTGYKASYIYILGPFLTTLLFHKYSIKRLVLYFSLLGLFLLLATAYVRGVGIFDAYNFAFHRAFYMTAYGDVGFLSVKDQLELSPIYFSSNILGITITKFLFEINSFFDLLSSSLSLQVSYLVYPDKYAVLNGTVNITVSSYSEAVFLLGDYYCFYPIIFSIFTAFVIKSIRAGFNENHSLKYALSLVYFYSVILPWLNSGTFLNLFSFYNFVYMFLTYILMRLLLRIRFTS